MPAFSYDLLFSVLFHLRDDCHTLFLCSIAGSELNRAASKLLYAKVVLRFPFQGAQLNLRDTGSLPANSNFSSACLPRNAPYVNTLEISGFPSSRPKARDKLAETISESVLKFTNLCSVTLVPVTFHEDIFTKTLMVLKSHCNCLTDMTINSSCTDEMRTSLLVQLLGLRKLTIESPTRAILDRLPEWTSRLISSLVELHFTQNCGSITPGVLQSLIPHVQANLVSFSLGLSYSLTDDDVFGYLGQLFSLYSVCLRYYLQLKTPDVIPMFQSLTSFTVVYPLMQTRDEVERLCRWTRRAITSSPIEAITLRHDEQSCVLPGAFVSFDSIFKHLAYGHHNTLRVIRMDMCFIGPDALTLLCDRCRLLEELHVAGGQIILTVFAQLVCMTHLHTVGLRIVNIKQNKLSLTDNMIHDIMANSRCLRRLAVNNIEWESIWESVSEHKVSLRTRRVR